MKLKNFAHKLSYPFVWAYNIIRSKIKYIKDNPSKVYSVTIPMLLFSLFGVMVILHIFQDSNLDTTALTNYGFAIMVGISAVCFSWVRALDAAQQPKMVDRIIICGEISFHGGIQFLVASALKYSALHLEFIGLKSWTVLYLVLKAILSLSSYIYFSTAIYNVYEAINGINHTLFERFKEGKKY